MLLWIDSAIPVEIEEWTKHPWVSGFTTNPTLIKHAGSNPRDLVKLTDKPLCIDGPINTVCEWGAHPKVVVHPGIHSVYAAEWVNYTAVCSMPQLASLHPQRDDVISVFAGRIMDTGRDPQRIIDAAKRTKARVLWASVREPYNIVQAEAAGCDIVTVRPDILVKYLEWRDKPLDVVADETIRQFHDDGQGVSWK